MDGAQSLLLNGLMQSDLDANNFRILNLDTSNFPPSGIPPTIVPPANNWLQTWDAPSQTWGFAQPGFSNLSGFLTGPQMLHIDQLGRVRVGTWQADIITQAFLPTLDAIRSPVGTVDMNGQRVTGVADPIDDTDAVNRRFMDFLLQGLNVKEAVRAATTGGDHAFAGLSPVDDVNIVAGDRILVAREETHPEKNGIWIASAGIWTRSTDCNTADELERAYCTVREGTLNGGTSWVQVNDITTINVDPVSFLLFSAGANINAGDGLVKVGNTLNVVGTTNRIDVGSAVNISPAYVGQATINTLGTVTTGGWEADIIASDFGGTGFDNVGWTIELKADLKVLNPSLAISPSLQFQVAGPCIVSVPASGTLATRDSIETFTNKRITKRVNKISSSAQPNINTDSVDATYITALATNITDMSANLTGTPTDSQELLIWIKDNGTPRTITWGTKFKAGTEVTLPTDTVSGFWLLTRFIYLAEITKWVITTKISNV